MTLPKPEIGLVVYYSYLWASEHVARAEEGTKNRPCAIVAATRSIEDRTVVTVFPITRTPLFDPRDAVELPAALQRHLGLDDERSWVVVTEFNRFVWPGVDLQPRPGVTPRRFEYGVIPGKFMARVIEVFDAARRSRRVAAVDRTERRPDPIDRHNSLGEQLITVLRGRDTHCSIFAAEKAALGITSQ